MSVPSIIIVAGPRSSGTRLMTRILVQSGCYGDFDNLQRMDLIDDERHAFGDQFMDTTEDQVRFELAGYDHAVIRRSVPHGCGWPSPDVLTASLVRRNLFVKGVLWMCRDAFANCQSMVSQGHEPTVDGALRSLQRALHTLGEFTTHVHPVIPVMYNQLTSPAYVAGVFRMLDLPLTPVITNVTNEDAKHYSVTP